MHAQENGLWYNCTIFPLNTVTIFLSIRGTDGWYNILSNTMKFINQNHSHLEFSQISYVAHYFLCTTEYMNSKQNHLNCEVQYSFHWLDIFRVSYKRHYAMTNYYQNTGYYLYHIKGKNLISTLQIRT